MCKTASKIIWGDMFFHKFYLVHSWILYLTYISDKDKLHWENITSNAMWQFKKHPSLTKWKNQLKTCVRYFSLFLKDKCISSLFRTKYIEKKFNLQLLFLPTARATTRYPPSWNFLFRKNNCMCNRDNARDVAACPDE